MSKNCTCQQYAVLVPIKTVASKGCKVSIAIVVHKRYPVIKESNAISHKTNLLAVQYMSWQTFAPMITTDPSLYMLKKNITQLATGCSHNKATYTHNKL